MKLKMRDILIGVGSVYVAYKVSTDYVALKEKLARWKQDLSKPWFPKIPEEVKANLPTDPDKWVDLYNSTASLKWDDEYGFLTTALYETLKENPNTKGLYSDYPYEGVRNAVRDKTTQEVCLLYGNRLGMQTCPEFLRTLFEV
jgi:hypothetical protein